MDIKKIRMIVTGLIALFSMLMILFNYATDDYNTMTAYVIAFTGWLNVFLDESKQS